jgi:hypothetical protein
VTPHVARITFIDPLRLRLHVVGEIHPGELSSRGYLARGDEWVLDLPPTMTSRGQETKSQLIVEFQVLRNLGYAFMEGDEFSPAEAWRNYLAKGAVTGDATFLAR